MNWDRVARARLQARGLLLIAVAAVGFVALLWVASPTFMGGPAEPAPVNVPATLMVVAAGLGLVFGLVWMWRIYRAPTQFDEGRWRYRGH
jgi:hypothetical protein